MLKKILAYLKPAGVLALMVLPIMWQFSELRSNVRNQFTGLQSDLVTLKKTTAQSRMAIIYNQRGYGYDYLNHIVSPMPDTSIMPVLRYPGPHPDHWNLTYLLLPQHRTEVDLRFIVGIRFREKAADEMDAIVANLITLEVDEHWAVSSWQIKTEVDFDVLRGISITLENELEPGALPIEINLYSSATDIDPIETWKGSINTAIRTKEYFFQLPSPLYNFSKNRGAEDFKLTIRTNTIEDYTPLAARVTFFGNRIDLQGYTIYHRDEEHFAAIENTFLNTILSDEESSWYKYLKEIGNVGVI